MIPPATGTLLLRRSYLPDDQRQFAQLSGDYNPVHLDAVIARRTLFGATAVHGLHLVLTALEALQSRRGQTPGQFGGVRTLTAKFPKPVLVGEKVRFLIPEQTEESCEVIGDVQGDVVLKIQITLGPGPWRIAESPLPDVPREPLIDSDFEALINAEGHLSLGVDRDLARQLFPHLTAEWGPLAMSELLALTRLVGMRCPGLHSIFGEIAVRFHDFNTTHFSYKVRTADARFRRLNIQVTGSCLEGQIVALVRPLPAHQPSMDEIKRVTNHEDYVGSIALVVGGSRGLGEITAKILAAGGGQTIITYHQGQHDAERVVEEIRTAGGRCEALRLDVQRGKSALLKAFTRPNPPRSVYYFPTPKIFARRRGFFSHALLEGFNSYYVGAFGRLLDQAVALSPSKLRVFYPSSVAVEQTDRESAEYAIAKRSGEDLCSYYNQHCSKVEILVERLPRLKTDQTLALLDTPADDTIEIMGSIIRRMEKSRA